MLKLRSKSGGKRALAAFASSEPPSDIAGALDLTFGKGRWLAVSHADAVGALGELSADEQRFVLVGAQSDDEATVGHAVSLIAAAKQIGCKSVLLAEALNPSSMHAIMRAGADDFLPLPVSASTLQETVETLGAAPVGQAAAGKSPGLIYAVYGVAGGVGATTLAVNLAWETALEVEKSKQRVAILDFNFLFGSVATYLDLPRREAIYEMLSDPDSVDDDLFGQALSKPEGGKLSALTSPVDALPLDIVEPGDVRRLIDLARRNFDYVFIDMPQTLTHWSDLILTEAEVFFAVMESDMRSAQNMLRFVRALQAEELPTEKLVICLSRAPSFTDLTGKSRIKRLEESLNITFAHRLPDGGKQVREACDQGEPLVKAAKGNALRKEIRSMAKDLVQAAEAARQGKIV